MYKYTVFSAQVCQAHACKSGHSADASYAAGAHSPETGAVVVFETVNAQFRAAGGPNPRRMAALPTSAAATSRLYAGVSYLPHSR